MEVVKEVTFSFKLTEAEGLLLAAMLQNSTEELETDEQEKLRKDIFLAIHPVN